MRVEWDQERLRRQDALIHGIGIARDGKRVDPAEFFDVGPRPARGHMPFPGHRTMAEVWEAERP